MSVSRLSVADWLYVLIGCVVVLAYFFKPDIAFNYTDSIPKGFYLLVDEQPGKGDYALLSSQSVLSFATERGYIAEGTSIGKEIVGTEGDTVTVSDKGVTINDRPQPNSKPLTKDSQGRVMPVLRDTLILTESAYFLLGGKDKSFDSRYFGPVRRDCISYKLKPLLTF